MPQHVKTPAAASRPLLAQDAVAQAPAAPAPVVIVPPITNSGANKTLSRTI